MTTVATEETFAKDIAKMMGAVPIPEESSGELTRYEFDSGFQTKIAAMAVRDAEFVQQTEGLVKPEYFENQAEATLVNLSTDYYKKYKRVPDTTVLMSLLKKGFDNKSIRRDMKDDIVTSFKSLLKTNIADRDFVVDEVAVFAQHQAMSQAILDSVELIDKRNFEKAFEVVKKAMEVGKSEEGGSYDYFEEVTARTADRKAEASGEKPKDGITTGMKDMDKELYHNGWGRRELTVFMGAPKAGKSTALGEYAKCASLAGYNVLYVTLEVSKKIIAERLDSNMTDIAMSLISESIMEIDRKVNALKAKAGRLELAEYPTGSMTPSMLRRLIAKHKAAGKTYDMICVDYADIMAPDYRYNDAIENSKSIYVGLRAIAQEENVALLTATQTNREGAKSTVARMEHVAEDFNRIRIADLVVSINSSDDEKKKGVARLFFAASRNQKGEKTIIIRQDFERMRFVQEILGVA